MIVPPYNILKSSTFDRVHQGLDLIGSCGLRQLNQLQYMLAMNSIMLLGNRDEQLRSEATEPTTVYAGNEPYNDVGQP